MPFSYLVVTGALSFLVTFLALPPFIRLMHARGKVSKDLHKNGEVNVADYGGICLLAGIVAGIVVSALPAGAETLHNTMVSLLTVTLLALIGLLHDLYDIRGRNKVLLCFLAGVPMIFLRPMPFSTVTMLQSLPGSLLLLAVPIAIATGANATNLLAGFNGLEASTTAIACAPLLAIAIVRGASSPAIVSTALMAACIAFLWYNRYPSRIFPGDVGTLPMGGLLVSIMMLGGKEILVSPILFLPHTIEMICKISYRFRPKSQIGHTKVGYAGNLRPPDYHAFVHLVMKVKPMTERILVGSIAGIEIVLALTSFLLLFIFDP